MGFALRTNIFQMGTPEQTYFARFPIQVAVLFSPRDSVFGDAFQQIFGHLDQLTGDQVAFFAVLDPPKEWLSIASSRKWWQDYQSQIGSLDFSYDDRALVRELARLFGVSWDEFPVLIVSNNLWSGECAICPTSQWDIESQLKSLTDLAIKWERPNIHHIISLLEDSNGNSVRFSPTNGDKRFKLSTIYRYLGTIKFAQQFNEVDFFSLLRETKLRLRTILNNGLNRQDRFRRNISPQESPLFTNDDVATDFLLEDVAGQLVAPATVASRARDYFRNLRYPPGRELPNYEALEDESIAMIEEALMIGNLIEHEDRHERDRMLRFNDFTPGAQGIWKAIEREMNYSIIQAARAARTIKMPDYFARYDPSTTDENLILVKTPYKVNINQQDKRRVTGRHVLLELGKGYHVTETLLKDLNPKFSNIISASLGTPFPYPYLNAWKNLIEIRNNGSHSDLLSQQEYEDAMNIFTSGIIESFIRIKDKMRR